jgi:hypothetical protein
MADVPEGTGSERQRQIRKEQHRPEQNEGYDEAARGGAGVRATNVGVPPNADETDVRTEDADDRAAREAANDVRRRDHSAD